MCIQGNGNRRPGIHDMYVKQQLEAGNGEFVNQQAGGRHCDGLSQQLCTQLSIHASQLGCLELCWGLCRGLFWVRCRAGRVRRGCCIGRSRCRAMRPLSGLELCQGYRLAGYA